MQQPFAHTRGLAALVLWTLALAAHAAGQNKQLHDPADANAPVPPTRYESVLATASAAKASSPADNWKELNRTVASYDSMSLTMDMAAPNPAGPTGAAAPAAAPAGTPAAPAPHAGHGVAPKTQPDPHAHHRPGAAK